MMTKTILNVVAKQRWDMKDEQTGREVKGAKIFVEAIADDENKVGMFPTTFSLDSYDDFAKFPTVPGQYECEMTMKAGSKGAFTIGNVTEVFKK